jgi:putative membrane-bound dehydrogenase-like protein
LTLTALPLAAFIAFCAIARADRAPTPAESLAALRLADPALKIELVAAEPDVVNPVAIAWDELGRLYVAEMTDYPTGPPGGRIKRLEDVDGDGRYERVTVFAEGLPYPTGVMAWNGGVLVTAAPDLLYLKDGDGDGRADVRKVILTGFGEGNQQLRVNSPTWGLDNWVYLANGRSGGTVRRPADPPARGVAIPRNDLRVRPATGEFEPVAGFSQFGLPRDDWGDRYPSWNTVPLRHVVLEEAAGGKRSSFAELRNVAEILDMSDGGRIFSLAPAQRRFNAETVAYFNATCGATIYRAALLDAYRGDAFVCEPLTSVVHHRCLEPDGPTFVARRVEKGREFLASTHSWFRPVNLATGPDGALYVVDFCRAWVEHPAFVPPALRDSVNFREGSDRGRLWRIVPRDVGARDKDCRPGEAATAKELVAHLDHPNGWCRDTAQRLIVERHEEAAIEPLKAHARESRPLGRVHALWALEGLGALDAATLLPAFKNAEEHVREHAARLAEGRARECEPELLTLAGDPSVRVRLRAAVALSTLDSRRAQQALARLAARDAESPWMASAILGGIGENAWPFLNTLIESDSFSTARVSAAESILLCRLATLAAARSSDSDRSALLARVAGRERDAVAIALVLGLVRGQARPAEAGLSWLESSPARGVRDEAVAVAKDAGFAPWRRVAALELLLETKHPAARRIVPVLLDPKQPIELQTAAARGVARIADAERLGAVFDDWQTYSLATRRVLLGSLASTVSLAERLIEAVARDDIPAAELDPATRDALRSLRDPKLQARVAEVLRSGPAADRRAVVERYGAALALRADPSRGRTLFVKHCQTCHALGGDGPRVGPDLASVAGRPESDLLASILDPSREVAPDGVAVVVSTTTGQILTGLLAEETPSAIRLRRAEGLEEVVPRSQIEGLRPTGRSLMPDGLEEVLRPQDLADLIGFLRDGRP